MLVIHTRIAPCEHWDAELHLSFEARSKSRLRCFSSQGEDVGLFLERGQAPLHDGECLQAEDVALQLGDGWLRLPDDYVLKAMLEQLGARVEAVEAPYQPEQGAYGGGHHHSHAGDAEFSYAPRLHQFGARK